MVSGAVYFSVMTPGARLRPHCGPTNSRLRVRRIAPSNPPPSPFRQAHHSDPKAVWHICPPPIAL